MSTRARRLVIALPLLGLAVTACGSQQAAPGTATSTTPSTPTIAVTDATSPRAGGPCQPSQLRLQGSAIEPALGHRYMQIAATNTGSGMCVLQGFPALTLYTAAGKRMGYVPSPGTLVEDDGSARARVVELPPQRHAAFRLHWHGGLAGADLVKPVLMTVTATQGSAPAPVTLAKRIITVEPDPTPRGDPSRGPTENVVPDELDIVESTKVEIGGWRLVAQPPQATYDTRAGGGAP